MAGPARIVDAEAPFGLGFPVRLARFAMARPRAVIAFFVVTMAAATGGALRVQEAEDLLDFIPPSDPDVRAFKSVGKTFGALRVAYIGLRAGDGDDVFSGEALRRIEAATTAIRGVPGVDSVDSLTTVEDVVVGEDGSPDTRQLVELDHLPATREEQKALRDKVLSREAIVGNFVSKSGQAALVLAYLADGTSDRIASHALEQTVRGALEGGPLQAVFGGAPFAASAIYEETQADVRRLTPIAVLILLGVILIAFRDPLGVVLTILSVAWSAVMVMALMALFHEPFTAASATLPVILFASGTSYAVHVLGRYYILPTPAEGQDGRTGDMERLLSALRIVGPPVAIASCTTAAGFVACLVMDIRPMRAFGIECAGGVLLAMASAFLLVPAVLALYPRGHHEPAATGRVGEYLAWLSDWSASHRLIVLSVSAVCFLVGMVGLGRLQVRMEPRQFFRPGSQPFLAERFLAEHFGGSQILQVEIQGDVLAPATLHEIARLETYARSLPHVTQATSILAPLLQLAGVMNGERRIPDQRAQVPQLLFFVEGRAFLKRLLTPERDRALVLIRTEGDSQALVRDVEGYMKARFRDRPRAPTRDDVAERIQWITRGAGDPIAPDALGRVLDAARLPGPSDSRLVAARRAIATTLLTGADESLPRRAASEAIQVPGGVASTIGELVERLALDPRMLDDTHPLRDAVISLAPSPEEGGLAWRAYVDKVSVRARELAIDDAMQPAGPIAPAAIPGIRDALADLFPSSVIAPVTQPLAFTLAGEPILDRGMSRSVRANHKLSMVVAGLFVSLFIGLLFRSVKLALVSIAPAALTLVMLFGGISLAGMSIDLGTSLVTSIATGAGSEFAMQYLWYLRRSSPTDVVRFVGPIMVISTLLIAAGFAVLAFGHSQPMRMFGALAALSMVGSALLTFLLVPALLGSATAGEEATPDAPPHAAKEPA